MTAEDLTIPVGKYDFVWATHDRAAQRPGMQEPPLVVMIHGFPGDSRSYGNVLGDLSAHIVKGGFHTLRFDLRGCGQSNKAAQFFTLKSAHEDCMSVLRWAEKLGYKKFYLIAEGLGATIAVTALTDAFRSMIAGMVFLWPILDMKQSWLATFPAMAAEAQKAGLDHIVLDNANVGFDFSREIETYNLTPLLGRITMPVMIHHGLEDEKAPPIQMDILRREAGTDRLEFVTYSGGGHGLKNAAFRDQLLRETRDFLKKIR